MTKRTVSQGKATKAAKIFNIYLASESPRRRELLSQAGIPFEVTPSSFAEIHREHETPEEYVLRNATGKGAWILEHAFQDKLGKKAVVISADTIEVLDD